jgi:hypothetical protein
MGVAAFRRVQGEGATNELVAPAAAKGEEMTSFHAGKITPNRDIDDGKS